MTAVDNGPDGDNPFYPNLSHTHYEELSVASGIADDVIRERGYVTVFRDSRADDRLRSLKIGRKHREPKTHRLPGLLVPLYRPTGEPMSVQFKPLKPYVDKDGRSQKYVSPHGRPAVVDMLPRHSDAAQDPTVELWVTEGAKKADALASHGVAAISLSGVWNWRKKHETLGDWEDLRLKGRKRVVVCFDSDAATNSQIAAAMTRLGHWLRNKGVKKVGYLVVPQAAQGDKVGVDDYLTWFGSLDDLRDAITSAPPKPDDTGDRFTDARLAETFADDILHGRYRYNVGLGWLAWDGRRWDAVADERLLDEVRRYALEKFNAAVKVNKLGDIRGWSAVCQAGRMNTVVMLAAGIEGIFTHADALDADPDLLNTPAGVVDLHDGEVMPHDPDLLMTKLTSGSYRPGAEHPDWKAALEAVPADTVDWLQVRLGAAISGHTTYSRVGLLRGGGENGKSLVFGTGVMRAIGDYATVAGPGVLERIKGNAPSPDRLALRGARIVLIEEMTEGRSLDVTALKQVTDVEHITARDLYGKNVTFPATHTLFVTSNYMPRVNETDHGVWRRLERIEFPYRFTIDPQVDDDRPGDPTLKARLRANDDGEHDAIVTWLVDGAIDAHEDPAKLKHPERVERDTARWRMEADRVLAFWAEHLVPSVKTNVILKDELMEAFNAWLKLGQHNVWGKETFHPRFAEHTKTRAHGVTEVRPRSLDGYVVSDPPAALDTLPYGIARKRPKRPRVYIGVRFRTETDDEKEAADQHKRESGPGWSNPSGNFHASIENRKFAETLDHPGPPPADTSCVCRCHRGDGDHRGYPCPGCDRQVTA